MRNEIKAKLQSSKGFYVGDICYVLDDEIYDDIWGAAGYEDGEYETPYGKFAVASTAFGDGEYNDNYGHLYGVDAGVIGIVPWEILEKQRKWKEEFVEGTDEEKLNYLGRFFEGTEAEFCATGRGNSDEDGYFEITIGDTEINIHTGGEEEEEDEDGWYGPWGETEDDAESDEYDDFDDADFDDEE